MYLEVDLRALEPWIC